jgi:hypothetical protein
MKWLSSNWDDRLRYREEFTGALLDDTFWGLIDAGLVWD